MLDELRERLPSFLKEYALIEKAFKTAEVFRKLQGDGVAGAVAALSAQPGTVASSLGQNPTADAVMSDATINAIQRRR